MLGIVPQAGRTVTDSIAEALSGRRLLIVLDNCEHVLDAAAELVEAVLARATTVKVIATSREGLRVGPSICGRCRRWTSRDGAASAAVELFVERARAVVAGFALDDEADGAAVTEICRRLDGIALAIELAAARMVSMSPQDVLDRLDRPVPAVVGFAARVGTPSDAAPGGAVVLRPARRRRTRGVAALFGVRRRLRPRRASPSWSATGWDEYAVLDLLDSLVRKSLVTAERVGGGTSATGCWRRSASSPRISSPPPGHRPTSGTVTPATSPIRPSPISTIVGRTGPTGRARLGGRRVRQPARRVPLGRRPGRPGDRGGDRRPRPPCWRFALQPLRAGRMGRGDSSTPPPPRRCRNCPASTPPPPSAPTSGVPKPALEYAERALALEADPRYDPFDVGWSGSWRHAHMVAGRMDRYLETYADLAGQSGFAHTMGLASLTFVLPIDGRADEAMAIADETVAAARAHGNPFVIAFALYACGRAFTEADPVRALEHLSRGARLLRGAPGAVLERRPRRDAAGLEAVHGELEHGPRVVRHHHRLRSTSPATSPTPSAPSPRWPCSSTGSTAPRSPPPSTAPPPSTRARAGSSTFPTVDHLRSVLGASRFDQCVATGAAMNLVEAITTPARRSNSPNGISTVNPDAHPGVSE